MNQDLQPKPPKHQASGNVYSSRGRWFARVSLGGGVRKSRALPTCATEEQASERAQKIAAFVERLRVAGHGDLLAKIVDSAAAADDEKMAELERIVAGIIDGTERKKKTPSATVETFATLTERWVSGELARAFPDDVKAKRSARHDGYRVGHVPERYRNLPVTSWTAETYANVMRELPATLSANSRRQVAQLVHRVFELAIHPLGLVSKNPVRRLPRKGTSKIGATLLPRHVAALGKAPVDLGFRVLWTFLAETGWRPSQAVGRDEPKTERGEDLSVPPLRWADVNFERAVAFLRRTKTTAAVEVELTDETVTALKAWRRLSPLSSPTDSVFVTTDGAPIRNVLLAETFRAHLTAAGITKETDPDLFPEGDDLKHRDLVAAYDLRSLFVTAALAQGRTPDWIMRHTLHVTLSMLETYRRSATHFAKHGPVPTMVQAVKELAHAATFAAADVAATSYVAEGSAVVTTRNSKRLGRRDSNSDKRNQKTASQLGTAPNGADLPENSTGLPTVADVVHRAPPGSAATSGDVTQAELEAALVRAELRGDVATVNVLRVALDRRQRERLGSTVVPFRRR